MLIRARDGLIRLRDEEKLLRQHLHMEGTRSGAQWTTAFKEEDTDRREMKMARGRYARGAPGKESDVIHVYFLVSARSFTSVLIDSMYHLSPCGLCFGSAMRLQCKESCMLTPLKGGVCLSVSVCLTGWLAVTPGKFLVCFMFAAVV